MSLIVETGAGVENANTYANVETVSSYCTDMGYSTWASASTDDQESAILRAMSYIEAQNWKGVKKSNNNPLEWPRYNVLDRNGYIVSSEVVPTNVVKALSEAAYRESVSAGTMQAELEREGRVKKKKIDVIEVEYFEGASGETSRPIIAGLLKGYIRSATSIEVIRS